MRGAALTKLTEGSLRETFATFDHHPGENQLAALRDLAATMETMADGELAPQYYLSCLAPGMGKTQTIIHFVKHLLASAEHADIGVILFVGRLAEIQTLVAEMSLPKESFAVLVNPAAENDKLNSMGNPNKKQARVLFTTQQMLEWRSRGKAFADLPEFYYNGKVRRVRVWDEAILPARPICVSVSSIEGMTNVVAKSRRALHAVIEKLINDIKVRKDREFVEIPNFEEVCDVDLNEALGIFSEEKKQIERAANDLWLLSGKTVVVRRELGGNTVLDYKNTLPDDLKPIVVADASGAVRKTYPHWTKEEVIWFLCSTPTKIIRILRCTFGSAAEASKPGETISVC